MSGVASCRSQCEHSDCTASYEQKNGMVADICEGSNKGRRRIIGKEQQGEKPIKYALHNDIGHACHGMLPHTVTYVTTGADCRESQS